MNMTSCDTLTNSVASVQPKHKHCEMQIHVKPIIWSSSYLWCQMFSIFLLWSLSWFLVEAQYSVQLAHTCIGANKFEGCVLLLWSFWHADNEFFLTEWNWPSCSSAGEWCLLLPGSERTLCGPQFLYIIPKMCADWEPVIHVAIWYSKILSWLLTLPTDLFSLCFVFGSVSVCKAPVEVYSIHSCKETVTSL